MDPFLNPMMMISSYRMLGSVITIWEFLGSSTQFLRKSLLASSMRIQLVKFGLIFGIGSNKVMGLEFFQLRRELMNLSQVQQSVSVYFTKLKTICEELNLYKPVCYCGKCTC